MDAVYTIEGLANHWQVSDKTVRRLIISRKLTAAKIGKSWRIKREWIEKYEAKRLLKATS